MDGNTIIGGITRHRAKAYCRNCGHIQEIHWVETGCSIDDYRDIECEICNHDNLLTDGDGSTTIRDWALLYGYRNFIAGNYPDMLPRFDYNGDGVTDSRDLDYAYLHLTGKLPPKVQPPQPAQTPKPYISPGGYWYPNGERANYEKTPSITIGWNPEDAPKMNRPALPESGVLPPLKRW